jgi:hypothetical protein
MQLVHLVAVVQVAQLGTLQTLQPKLVAWKKPELQIPHWVGVVQLRQFVTLHWVQALPLIPFPLRVKPELQPPQVLLEVQPLH